MASLIVHCPNTSAVINTGIDTDYKSLARSWNKTVLIPCPHCNDEHEVNVRDAYVRGEVSNFALRGA